MEEYSDLLHVQRVRDGVESRTDSPLFLGTQGVELAEAMAVLRPRGAMEVSVVEISG